MRKLLVGLFLLTAQAQAGIMLEPYAGYYMGTFEGKFKLASVDFKLEESGLAFGGRAGYVLPLGVWFAGDVFWHPLQTAKISGGGLSGDRTSSRTMFFIDVGMDLPVLPLRFWAGYGLVNNWKTSGSNTDSDWTGSAIKLGAGYKAIPLLSINLEYMMHNLDKVKTPSGEMSIGDVYDNPKSSTFLLSVSAPLSL